jgi:hypothetical protein
MPARPRQILSALMLTLAESEPSLNTRVHAAQAMVQGPPIRGLRAGDLDDGRQAGACPPVKAGARIPRTGPTKPPDTPLVVSGTKGLRDLDFLNAFQHKET